MSDEISVHDVSIKKVTRVPSALSWHGQKGIVTFKVAAKGEDTAYIGVELLNPGKYKGHFQRLREGRGVAGGNAIFRFMDEEEVKTELVNRIYGRRSWQRATHVML